MRKLIVLSMISLDGVIQSPCSPDEDRSGGFESGGWVAPFDDDDAGTIMQKLMQPSDLLLGRKTFEIWENYWPQHEHIWPGISDVRKYVYSATRNSSNWRNCYFINGIEAIRNLKRSSSSDLQVWGSGEMIQLLLQNDLVDELWLMIHPITIGSGKKLFADGPIPAAFHLSEHLVTGKGVFIGHYERAGNIQTGTIGA